MLTKLLFRTLPDYYPAGSTFAHFPFLVPDVIKKCMEKHLVNRLDKYTWIRPPVPKGFVTVDTYDGVSQVTTEKSKFMSGYDNRLSNITTPAVLERSLVRFMVYAHFSIVLICEHLTSGKRHSGFREQAIGGVLCEDD